MAWPAPSATLLAERAAISSGAKNTAPRGAATPRSGPAPGTHLPLSEYPRPDQRAHTPHVLLMRGLAGSPLVPDNVSGLQHLMPWLRVGMDDRRRQPLEPLQLLAVGDPASLSRAVRRNQRGEQPGGSQGPFTASQAAGVGSALPSARNVPCRNSTETASISRRDPATSSGSPCGGCPWG